MRLKTDESAAQWLHDFVADPENFDWDEGNIRKNLKHGYSAEQIESLFLQTEYIFAVEYALNPHMMNGGALYWA